MDVEYPGHRYRLQNLKADQAVNAEVDRCATDIAHFLLRLGAVEPQPYQVNFLKARFSPIAVKLWLR